MPKSSVAKPFAVATRMNANWGRAMRIGSRKEVDFINCKGSGD